VEERREAGLKWQTAFLQVIAAVMTNGFDRLFGERLLSIRAVAGSITLSAASLFLLGSLGVVIVALGERPKMALLLSVFLGLGLGLFSVWLLVRGSFKAMVVFDATFVGLTIVLPIVSFLTLFHDEISIKNSEVIISPGAIRPRAMALGLSIGFAGSLLSDVVFVAVTRWALRRSVSSGSALRILGLIGLNMLLAVVLVLVPAVVANLLHGGSTTFDDDWWAGKLALSMGPMLMTTLNLFDALLALAVVALGAVMLIHRLIWPLIGRPLEVISSEHILLKRGTLFFGGLTLLGASWPLFGAWLKLLQGK
jgi:hypothetical protein